MTETNTPETDLLFQHFGTLATGPDGIARLRELILQLAVQGKLGTQDEGDEPASVLLERIRKEKERLVKEGRIKMKTLPTLSENELSYKLPIGWNWVTLNDVFLDIRSGGTPNKNNPQFWNGDINWASVKDLKNRKFLESTQDKITQKGLEACRSKLIPPGSLIICVRMGLGKIAINTVPLAINQDLKSAQLSENVDINYFYYYYRIQTVKGTGMTVDGIRQEKLLQMPFPLPPLAEQHRIVEKVDRLMALCDELEKHQQQERSTCLQLGTASFAGLQDAETPEEFERQWAHICDTFDLMLDCPENVAVLRQAILQLAVQGKLGTQDEGDEPASVLLERIRQEKERLVKEGKTNSKQFVHQIRVVSQTLPDNWLLCMLGDVSEIIMGNSPPGDSYNTNGEGIALINGPTEFSKDPLGKTIVSQYTTQPTKLCIQNDLLICVRGATTGRTNIAGCDACIGRGVAAIRSPLIQCYLNLFILTKAQIILDMGTGSTFPSISKNDLLTLPLPLPPLAEQHRIVEKVDRLMALCDQLEAQLKERAGVQECFAKAVVKSVAE